MNEPNYDAAKMLRAATKPLNIHLSTLGAETGLWAHPEVHKKLFTISGSAAFFPDRRRARTPKGEKRGQHIGNVTLDDNTYANNAIKRAIGVKPVNLLGFEACHIWSDTCYDERYHNAIANLILLPRGLVAAGVMPKEIASVLYWRGSRLFRSAPGKLLRNELVQRLSMEAKNRGKTFDPTRFFCEDTDLIFVGGGHTYAFSSQWGADTELAVDALLKTFLNCNVTCRPTRQ